MLSEQDMGVIAEFCSRQLSGQERYKVLKGLQDNSPEGRVWIQENFDLFVGTAKSGRGEIPIENRDETCVALRKYFLKYFADEIERIP